MQFRSVISLGVLGLLTPASFARPADTLSVSKPAVPSFLSLGDEAASVSYKDLRPGAYYRFNSVTRLKNSYLIMPDTDFVILGIDEKNDTITMGIETDEDSTVPPQLTLPRVELAGAQLSVVRPDQDALAVDDDRLELAADEGFFEEIVASDGAGLAAHRVPRRRGRTPSCYKDVKLWLLRHGLVSSYPAGIAAWTAYSTLKQEHGFTDVEFSQALPNGAVCVSEGGNFNCPGGRRCGHIAVKIGEQRWYGAGVYPHPLLRNHYNLRCLISPQQRVR